MRLKQHIWFLLLSLSTLLGRAQILDTICVEGGRQSNLAVPYTPGASYEWSIGGGIIISKPDSNDVLVDWSTNKGLYLVSVVSTFGTACYGDTSKAYIYLTLPNYARIEGPEEVCRGTEVKLEAYAGSVFAWLGGKSSQTIKFVAERDTSVYLVALNGPCQNDTTVHTIRVRELPNLDFDGPSDTVPLWSFQDFMLLNENASGYAWLAEGQEVSQDPLYIHHFNKPGEFNIGVVAKFGQCIDTLIRKYYVFDDFAVHIPNAFTPNGDGTNERFLFKGVGIKSFEAQVYTRWGQKIYSWNETTEEPGWDGQMADGTQAPLGVYLYKIFVTDYYGGVHPYSGQFSLLR